MNLEQARLTYLGKVCDVHWEPLDRPKRNGEAIMRDTLDVPIKEVYLNCHNQVMFLAGDKIYTPFPIERLKNPR